MTRRRALLLGGLAALLVVLGLFGVLSENDQERRQRTQLENVAPGAADDPEEAVSASRGARRVANEMSLRQQVAQIFAVDVTGQTADDPFFAEFRRRRWGAVVLGQPNFTDEVQLQAFVGEIGVVARQAGPALPLIAANQEGGPSSAFPDLPPRAQPLIGDTRRPAVARSEARATAQALKNLGINMNLAPVADVGTAAGPLQGRVYSDNAQVVTRMVRAAVEGYRGARLISAVKHFPGVGGASADPSTATATIGLSVEELKARDLRPFAAVARRVPVVVVSNAVYAGFDGVTPAVLLPEVVGGLLRRDLGFRGVVMTDDLNSTAPVLNEDIRVTAIQALEAGADLLYVSGGGDEQRQAYDAVVNAVRRGRVSRQRLRLSVLRVLALKQGYGLLPGARERPRRRSRADRPPRRAPAPPPGARPRP